MRFFRGDILRLLTAAALAWLVSTAAQAQNLPEGAASAPTSSDLSLIHI